MTAPDLNARLGAVIRQKRVLLGLSQEAIGKRIGVTFQQVQKYEKGRNQLGFSTLVAIAEALETSVGELAQAALGEQAPACEGVSDRETLELMKRIGKLTPAQVSYGKYANVRAALDVAREARTTLGGAGITLDHGVMRHMNNLETVMTYEGTEEMHLLSIGSELTGIPAFR